MSSAAAARELPTRYIAFVLVMLGFVLSLPLAWLFPWVWAISAVLGFLFIVGIVDLTQRKQAIRRNYPILAHMRFFLESIRPELRQYFFESDTDQTPFARSDRALVYQRAKNLVSKRPYGTQLNVYAEHYEWVNHSLNPKKIENEDFRVEIGAGVCEQPYSCSVLNVSAMSFGALSANAIMSLNRGAQKGGFAHDTGEGSVSVHHRKYGGDLIWEVGTGYFGCRDEHGRFSAERFRQTATNPQVKMIELKVSQGAKPGQGGILPGAKVTREISEARGVPIGKDCISPPCHSAFSTPVEMMQFLAKLRELSGGKPVGFKLCIGHPWEFFAMCKAMIETGLTPDFIVVDGAEGGTGAAPIEFTDHVGTPLSEGLLLVHNTLVGLNLRPRIKLGASGKIITAFDMARRMAIGADFCNSARGFMFAVGCIQAQTCHTDHCPTGVATQDPLRQRALVVEDKYERVYHFHRNTLHGLAELLGAAGVMHPDQIGPHHIVRRVSPNEVRLVSNLLPFLKPGSLLNGATPHPVYATFWNMASAHSFEPVLDTVPATTN